MKKLLKYILLFVFSLLTADQIWHNLTFQNMPLTIVKVALVLAIFELLLKPILKVLLLPINLITLGFFRIIIDTLGFYLAVFLLNDFKISNIYISGYNYYVKGFFAYLLTSFTVALILNIYNFILRKNKPKK